MKKENTFKQAVGFIRGINIREGLKYESLVKNLPMILLISFLALVYIWNRHSANRHIVELQKTQNELKEYNWEFASAKKELNNKSMQSEVARMVRPIGLEEISEPPIKIYIAE